MNYSSFCKFVELCDMSGIGSDKKTDFKKLFQS